ncbi:hypothetical protein D3C86_2235000 [compost metagenome]
MTEEDRLRMEKLRHEVDKAKSEAKAAAGDEEAEDDGFITALQGKAAEVWADEKED